MQIRVIARRNTGLYATCRAVQICPALCTVEPPTGSMTNFAPKLRVYESKGKLYARFFSTSKILCLCHFEFGVDGFQMLRRPSLLIYIIFNPQRKQRGVIS